MTHWSVQSCTSAGPRISHMCNPPAKSVRLSLARRILSVCNHSGEAVLQIDKTGHIWCSLPYLQKIHLTFSGFHGSSEVYNISRPPPPSQAPNSTQATILSLNRIIYVTLKGNTQHMHAQMHAHTHVNQPLKNSNTFSFHLSTWKRKPKMAPQV